MQVTCQGCSSTFEASRKSAKWCSNRCRMAAKRREPRSDVPVSPAPAQVDADAAGLVASVRRELEQAGRVETFSGQLALQLARRLADPEESGISSLSKELRTVMANALEGAIPAPAAGDDGSPTVETGEPDDEVTRARRQREEARQAAGLA